MFRTALHLGALALAALSASSALAEPIEWTVVNRYRLFDAATTSRPAVTTLLETLAANRAQGRPLAESYASILQTLHGSQAADLRASNWSATSRTYDADYLYPEKYQIEARLIEAVPGACIWRVDGVAVATEPCTETVALELAAGALGDGWGARGDVEVLRENATPVRQTIVLRDLLIVAMGDSFISGEGNPDVPADLSRLEPSRARRTVNWPGDLDPAIHDVDIAEWWDEPCHRTLLSWPVTTTLVWAAEDAHRAVTLVHTGCSGAKVQDGLRGRQPDLPGCPEGGLPLRNCAADRKETRSQLDQTAALIGDRGRPIDRVLLSIGGNDIGFVGVIAFAMVPPNGYVLPDSIVGPIGREAGVVCPDREVHNLLLTACGNRPTAADRLADVLPAAYSALKNDLVAMGVTPDKVVQTSYPDILHDEGGGFCQHAWTSDFLDEWSGDPGLAARQRAYAASHPAAVVPAGFEATQATIEPLFRGVKRWAWQFDADPGFSCKAELPTPSRDLYRDGSDVCGAFRTWTGLNRAVAENGARSPGWAIVSGHLEETNGHGWCRGDERYPLDLVVAGRRPLDLRFWDRPYDRWVFDRDGNDRTPGLDAAALAGPGAYDPYDFDQPRWFRTSVDSFRTQFGGPRRLIQGTFHPTFRTHIAYAQAVLNESPPLPR